MQLSESDREELYALLTRHAAADRLSTVELERRVEIVGRADTREAALEALDGLPALSDDPAAPSTDRPRWGRGHGDADSPQAEWRPTGERFRDPRTGKVMRVWEDASGNRHYVPD